MGITVRSRGQNGEILVEDERADGTQVYLVCRPFGAQDTDSGVFVGPAGVPAEDKERQGIYPLLGLTDAPEPFRLTIDTTALPAGLLEFRSDAFVAKAQESARQGVERVRLHAENLEEWGVLSSPEPGGTAHA